jgi:hypothetical protein
MKIGRHTPKNQPYYVWLLALVFTCLGLQWIRDVQAKGYFTVKGGGVNSGTFVAIIVVLGFGLSLLSYCIIGWFNENNHKALLSVAKRLSAIEKSAVAIGFVFVVVGTYIIFHPKDMYVFSFYPERYKFHLGPPNPPEHVSEQRSQTYGGVAILIGVGFGWLGLYRRK